MFKNSQNRKSSAKWNTV